MKPKNDLTADYVRKILDYDPETGILTWRERVTRRGGNYRVGKPAGKRAKGHIMIGIGGRHYVAARLAWLWMTGEWPDPEVDHFDRDPYNDRWSNLREATRGQNNFNRTSKAPFRGVRPWGRKWQTRIKYDGKSHHLGHFDTAEEASEAYRRAAQAHWGDFRISD